MITINNQNRNNGAIYNPHYELFHWLKHNPQGNASEFIAQHYYGVSKNFRRFAFEITGLQNTACEERNKINLVEIVKLNEERVEKILQKYGTNERTRQGLVKKICRLVISRGLGVKFDGLAIKKN